MEEEKPKVISAPVSTYSEFGRIMMSHVIL
jgi:hypothetical protein